MIVCSFFPWCPSLDQLMGIQGDSALCCKKTPNQTKASETQTFVRSLDFMFSGSEIQVVIKITKATVRKV